MAMELMPYKTVNIEDVIPDYRTKLTEINSCLNLFDELDKRRNFSEWVSDWAVGERRAIDFKSITSNLKKIKSELEKGIKLHSNLLVKLNSFEMMDNTYQQKIRDSKHSAANTSQLVEHHNDFVEKVKKDCIALSTAVVKLKNTGVFERKEFERDFGSFIQSGIEMGAKGGAVGGAGALGAGGSMALANYGYLGSGLVATKLIAASSLLGITTTGGALAVGAAATGGVVAVAGAIGCIAYLYAQPKGKKRGFEYQELKFLCDGLNNGKLLAAFQTHHTCIHEISNGIDKTLKMCDKHFEKRIVDYGGDLIKATRIYYQTFHDNLQMLKETETEMSEDMRNRLAANIAVIACRTFLKETLKYSDSGADEFIQKLKD